MEICQWHFTPYLIWTFSYVDPEESVQLKDQYPVSQIDVADNKSTKDNYQNGKFHKVKSYVRYRGSVIKHRGASIMTNRIRS